MVLTDDKNREFDESDTLIGKLKVLRSAKIFEVLYNKVDGDFGVSKTTALVQCFFGTDIKRIIATTRAIEFNLQMSPRPREWVFVECQFREDDCAFKWVQRYGIKHKFVKMDSQTDGILIKHALWNIGVSELNSEICNFCFVDSDVVMCDSDWLAKSEEQFKKYDVLSLSAFNYYEVNEHMPIQETIGHSWSVANNNGNHPHCGFHLGLTRKAYDSLGGLMPSIILDDVMTYTKICGKKNMGNLKNWALPYSKNENENGFDLRLGYVDTISCHIWHGDDMAKYNAITSFLREVGIGSNDELFEYEVGGLPRWRNGRFFTSINNAILRYYSADAELNIMDMFIANMNLGGFTKQMRKTYAVTCIESGFGVDLDSIVKFRNEIELRLWKFNPIVVVITDVKLSEDEISENGLNIVPISPMLPCNYEQMKRKDLDFSLGSELVFVPFGKKVRGKICILNEGDEDLKFSDGTYLTLKR